MARRPIYWQTPIRQYNFVNFEDETTQPARIEFWSYALTAERVAGVFYFVTVHGVKTIEIKVNNRMLPAIRVKNAPKSVAYGQEPSFIA